MTEYRKCYCGKPITDSEYSKICADCYNDIELQSDCHAQKERQLEREARQWESEQNNKSGTLLYNAPIKKQGGGA